MKRSDIPDLKVLLLANKWMRESVFEDGRPQGIVDSLVESGVPFKVALRKVEHMESRGLLESGTSPNYAWPTPAGQRIVRDAALDLIARKILAQKQRWPAGSDVTLYESASQVAPQQTPGGPQ